MNPILQMPILQQFWKDFSWEIVANSLTGAWWKEVGSQKAVSCNACTETQGGHVEHFLSSSEGINSESML
jgi:hypothetical protein